LSVRGLPVRQHPYVGGDAGVVEDVERQGDDGLQPVVLDDPSPDVALTLPGVSGEQGTSVVDLGDPASERRVPLHLGELVRQEEHLAVAAAGDEGVLRVVAVLDQEPGIAHVLLAAHAREVRLPALAVGRVGEHEVELAGREGVVRERGMLRPADDVVGGRALTLEQQVSLADGVGLGVDLLAEEVRGDRLAALGGERLEHVLGHGEDAARTAGAVVEGVGSGLEPVGHGQEDEVRHQLDRVARREVLAGLLAVLLVEAADQPLEDRAHAVVVEAGVLHAAVFVHYRFGPQVDVGRGQLLDQRAECVGP